MQQPQWSSCAVGEKDREQLDYWN